MHVRENAGKIQVQSIEDSYPRHACTHACVTSKMADLQRIDGLPMEDAKTI